MRCLFTVAVMVLSQLLASSAHAQWAEDQYVEQSLTGCFDLADWFVENGDHGYAPGVSLVGSFMNPGERFSFELQLTDSTRYVIIAAGDEDANDVDLRIMDNKGRVITEDTSTDPDAIIEFRSGRGGTHTVEVELYSADNDSFVSFVVLSEHGGYVPLSDLDLAATRMLDIWRVGSDLADEERGVLNFNRNENQPCLYGALLDGQELVAVTGLNFGQGEMLAVASGDSDATDIDLVLYDENTRELEADRNYDRDAVVSHRTSSRRSYEVEMINAADEGTIPAFCIVGLLQIR